MAEVFAWIFVEVIGASFLKFVSKLKKIGVPTGFAEFIASALVVLVFTLLVLLIIRIF